MSAPVIRAYPREASIAEKLHAMVDLDIRNSRMKDFYDIWFMANTWDFEQRLLRSAIAFSFERRGMAIPRDAPFALTEEFLSDPQKTKQWKAFLERLSSRKEADLSLVEVGEAASISRALPLAADGFCIGSLDAERRLEGPCEGKMIHSVVAVSGTGSGTHISLARLRQITLNCGEHRIYLYAKFPSITLIYHRLTVFSGNSKSAEGNLVGVRPPLPAPLILSLAH